MNDLAVKLHKKNQKLEDKLFRLQVFIQKHNSQIGSRERKEIIKRLIIIQRKIDPYHQYHDFFPNRNSIEDADILTILDDFILILTDIMFDFDNTLNELSEYTNQEETQEE